MISFVICSSSRQRLEQSQREKIEARLHAARQQQPSNMIHVRSQMDDGGDDQQQEMTKKSLQLLNDPNNSRSQNSTTPIYGDENIDEKVVNIDI